MSVEDTHDTLTESNRRREERLENRDVIRWKRPGRIEDNKGWTCDRSSTSIGFLAMAEESPVIGDVLHIRRLDHDRWDIINEAVRVARITPTPTEDLAMIGCTFEPLPTFGVPAGRA